MDKRTVVLKIEMPLQTAELLAAYGDQLLSVFSQLVGDAKRASNSGEIAEIIRRIEAKADTRRALILSVGRTAQRQYRKRLISQPSGLSSSDQKKWRATIEIEIARDLEQALDLVKVALSRYRANIRYRVHRCRMIYALRAELHGDDRKTTARRFNVPISTVKSLITKARNVASTKGLSLSDLEQGLTAERQAEIRAAHGNKQIENGVIAFNAIKISKGAFR